MDDPIDTDKDGHPLTLMDVIAEEDNTFENLDLKINSEKLYRYIAETLDDRERDHRAALRPAGGWPDPTGGGLPVEHQPFLCQPH